MPLHIFLRNSTKLSKTTSTLQGTLVPKLLVDGNVRKKMTHVGDDGNTVMVDVSDKAVTVRAAVGQCTMKVTKEVMQALVENKICKGDALEVARIAGIQAAKMTSNLIPLCHNIPLNAVQIRIELLKEENLIKITTLAKTNWKTGVEMESLISAAITALTIYDMCKSITNDMTITDIKLTRKSGGKQDIC